MGPLTGSSGQVSSSQAQVWQWLRGEPALLLLLTRAVRRPLSPRVPNNPRPNTSPATAGDHQEPANHP